MERFEARLPDRIARGLVLAAPAGLAPRAHSGRVAADRRWRIQLPAGARIVDAAARRRFDRGRRAGDAPAARARAALDRAEIARAEACAESPPADPR
jgi:hypothetical protein